MVLICFDQRSTPGPRLLEPCLSGAWIQPFAFHLWRLKFQSTLHSKHTSFGITRAFPAWIAVHGRMICVSGVKKMKGRGALQVPLLLHYGLFVKGCMQTMLISWLAFLFWKVERKLVQSMSVIWDYLSPFPAGNMSAYQVILLKHPECSRCWDEPKSGGHLAQDSRSYGRLQ